MSVNKRQLLKERASHLEAVRQFFKARDVVEVDTFTLAPGVIVDEHIDLMPVHGFAKPYYLLSSPEGPMKQLIAQGSGDIFQLGHVYRQGESGRKHCPVFTMLEWYQIEASFETFLHANCQLLSLFVGEHPTRCLSYHDAFIRYANLPSLSEEALLKALGQIANDLDADRQALEHLAWAELVEPNLGKGCFEVITDYPEDQAALAQIEKGKAKRFEIYFEGMELGNGYCELQHGAEYQKRLETQNDKRALADKPTYPIDTALINTLKEQPLPRCFGIAIGFDRLLMLKLGAHHINDVLPLPFLT